MQSDSSKVPVSSVVRQTQLQPKHVSLASTSMVGQPLLPRLPTPTVVSTVQNIGQFVGQPGQPGMYVQGLFQPSQIGTQGQRAPVAFGVYQHPAQLYQGSQTRQLSPRIPSYQGTSQASFQQALPGVIPGMRLALPGQSVSSPTMITSGKILEHLALWIKTSADNILKYFSYFSQKTGFDISDVKFCFLGKVGKISAICCLLN